MDDQVAIELIARNMASGAIKDVGRDLGGLKGAVSSASASLKTIGSNIQSVGTSLTMKMTLPIALAGAAVWKMSADFETAMNHIVGLVGVAEEQVAAWKDEVLDLSRETGQSATTLAEALYFVTSAGIADANAMDVLEASAKAAAAGLGEANVVADALTTILNAYGQENITSAEATDILTAAVKYGKLEADQLAAVMGMVVPGAAQLGVAFDDVAGAIAAMSMVGLDASMAATSLGQIFNQLLKPSKGAKDALAEVGLSAQGLRKSLQEDGVLATLQILEDAFQGDEEAMARVFPNIQALRGAFALLSQDTASVETVLDGVTNSTGTMEAAFEAASGTSMFKFQQVMAEIGALLIEIGDTVMPIVSEVFEGLAGVLSDIKDAWTGLSPEMQKFIVIGALIAAAVGPILIGLGMFISLIGTAVGALAIFMSPVVLLGGALLFVAAKTGVLNKVFEAIGPVIEEIAALFGGLVEAVGNVLSGNGGIEEIGEVFEEIGPRIGKALSRVGQTILAALPAIIAGVGGLLASIAQAVVDNLPVIAANLLRMAQKFVDWVSPYIPVVLAELAKWANSIFGWIVEQAPILLTKLLALGKQLISWITDRIPDALAALSDWASSIFDWIVNTGVPLAADALGNMALAFVDWVVDVAPDILTALGDVIDAIAGFIAKNAPVLAGKLLDWAVAFVGWIATEVVPKLIAALPGILRAVVDFLGRALITIVIKAAELGAGLVEAIMSRVRPIPGNIAGFIGQIPGRIGGFLGTVGTAAAQIGSKLLNGVIDLVKQMPGKVAGFIAALPGRIGEYLVTVGNAAKGLGTSFLNGVSGIVSGLAGKLWSCVSAVIGKLPSWASALASSTIKLGSNFVSGFIKGLASLPSKLATAVKNAFKSIHFTIGPFHVSSSGVTISLPNIKIPGFAIGAWKLPTDMVAQVHKGEMIIPADLAARLRGEKGSGGMIAATPTPQGGGTFTVSIVQNFGPSSVRSAEDIREIGRRTAQDLRLLGLPGMAPRVSGG